MMCRIPRGDVPCGNHIFVAFILRPGSNHSHYRERSSTKFICGAGRDGESRQLDLSNDIMKRVGDIQVTAAINGNATRSTDRSLCSLLVITIIFVLLPAIVLILPRDPPFQCDCYLYRQYRECRFPSMAMPQGHFKVWR